METYTFRVVIAGDFADDDLHDRLFEAGCDDAVVSELDSTVFLEFDRDADSLAAAVSSALRAVAAADVEVRRVLTDDLVTMAEIAERAGRTRESVRLLIEGDRGPGGFPPPRERLGQRMRLWSWAEVAGWLVDVHGDQVDVRPDPTAALVAEAVNGRLAEHRLDAAARGELAGV